MSGKQTKERILLQKIIFTFIILGIYLLGRSIPLYGIDLSAIAEKEIDAEMILQQTIGGDLYQRSLFAIGVTPYMIANILVQIVLALKSKEKKKMISRIKSNRVTVEIMLLIALFQALTIVRKMKYVVDPSWIFAVQLINVLQMVAGVVIILWLSEKNKKYGIGGQTVLFLINIASGMANSLKGHSLQETALPLLIGVLAMIEAAAMELNEKRIAVQRISIHNIYADQNYLAIKMNPIGIMPVMFSTAFFALPQFLVYGGLYFFPLSSKLHWLQENLVLTKPLGILVYVMILYFLTILFARVMINPKDITEQFLKSGDCLENLHPGDDTRRFLSKTIMHLSLLGATVMSLCMAVPMILSYGGSVDSSLMMFPSSLMMFTGMGCSLYQEIKAIRHIDSYRMFM